MSAKTWTTKDGRTVKIAEMGDAHLCNTIAYLRRTARGRMLALAFSAGAYAQDAPDGAAMAAERAEDEAYDALFGGEYADAMTPDEILAEIEPRWTELRREAKRRGLWSRPPEVRPGEREP